MTQLQGVRYIAAMPVIAVLKIVEAVLYVLMDWYEHWLYYPLQKALWPVVMKIPRTITVDGRTITVFTANIVSWARTLLVLPVAVSLKYNYYWTGAFLIIFHDFLDHVDGIVAKVHKEKYGPIDDPTLGGFMDAFCDKIVSVMTLWTTLVVTDFSGMTNVQGFIYGFACVIIIAYEFVLGVVRVQDYFKAHYLRIFNQIDSNSSKASTAAGMAGKLKEKLESIGMAALCVSQASANPLLSISGLLGVTCLYLSIRLAHTSLMSKINVRSALLRSKAHASDDEDEKKVLNGSAAPEVKQGNGKVAGGTSPDSVH